MRVLDNFNRTDCEEGAQGMAYAVKAGAQVVNFSVGEHKTCQAEADVINDAPNVLFVAAAMNDGADNDKTPIYPCVNPAPNVICVAASDANDQLWKDSNFGAQSVDELPHRYRRAHSDQHAFAAHLLDHAGVAVLELGKALCEETRVAPNVVEEARCDHAAD